jgi:hypothetical protein
VPDVRIEYETRDGERGRVDLELATGHYRGRNLTEKFVLDSRSTLMRMTCQRLRGFWISVK